MLNILPSNLLTYHLFCCFKIRPFLQLDQDGNPILPLAQTHHANYQKQPFFMEKITFCERITHYGVPFEVSLLEDIVGQVKLVRCLSRNCVKGHAHPHKLYVYILPAGTNFLDMINWKTTRPSTIGRRLMKCVETFAHNGYGGVLGPLLLLMYLNVTIRSSN